MVEIRFLILHFIMSTKNVKMAVPYYALCYVNSYVKKIKLT